MVLQALVAGQNRVVVGHRDRRPAADRADAGDEAVRGRALDEVLQLAAATLGGDHERAVLHEAAGVDEVVDVLAGRSEEHTSELPSLMRISYAVFCLKKKLIKIRLNSHR